MAPIPTNNDKQEDVTVEGAECRLILYRHGLRRSEAARLRWSDVDLEEGTIYIRRIKGSRSGRHPLQGDELRALKKLKRDSFPSPFVFTGNRHLGASLRHWEQRGVDVIVLVLGVSVHHLWAS